MVVLDCSLEVLDWLEIFGLEDGRVGYRIWYESLSCKDSDLRVWVGDEADELYDFVSDGAEGYMVGFFFTSSSSVGMVSVTSCDTCNSNNSIQTETKEI